MTDGLSAFENKWPDFLRIYTQMRRKKKLLSMSTELQAEKNKLHFFETNNLRSTFLLTMLVAGN